MPKPKRILILDDRDDSRGVLSGALRRELPKAVLIECSSFGEAAHSLISQPLDLLIVHQLANADCATLVEQFRRMGSLVPIVAVCAQEEHQTALAAGATGFISLDEWLLLGETVEVALQQAR